MFLTCFTGKGSLYLQAFLNEIWNAEMLSAGEQMSWRQELVLLLSRCCSVQAYVESTWE